MSPFPLAVRSGPVTPEVHVFDDVAARAGRQWIGETAQLHVLTVACSTRRSVAPSNERRMLEASADLLRRLIETSSLRQGVWLFAAQPFELQANRISKHKRLWRSALGLSLTQYQEIDWKTDVAVDLGGAVRYAGVGSLEPRRLVDALRITRDKRSHTSVVLSARDLSATDEVIMLFEDAFPRTVATGLPAHTIAWASYIPTRSSRGDLVVKVTGGWEERRLWIEVFGRQTELAGLAQASAVLGLPHYLPFESTT